MSEEFDKIIGRMSQTSESNKRSGLGSIIGFAAAACCISFFGGLLLMWMNMILVNEFPNFSEIQPGIGFLAASRFFFLIFIMRCVFEALRNTQKNS
jgi:hypothetical protein